MINDTISGISIRLREIFGKDYRIYTEEVKQGLKEPCFIISHITSDTVPLLGRRKKIDNAFCITYIPAENEGKYKSISDVQFKLITNMEYIKTLEGDNLRGTGIRTETNNGVLHFFVNYNFIVICKEDSDYMEKLNIKEAKVNGN